MAKTTHIAIVPSPWFSNLVSALEFCKRLVLAHPDFHVHFILPILESPPQAFKACLQSLPSNIEPILLPPIRKDEMPPGTDAVVQMKLTVSKSLPLVQEELTSLTSKTPLAALITDPFAYEALDFAKELNAMSFVYIATGATALSAFLQIPKLNETVSCEFRDMPEPIDIPGCVQLHGIDLPEPVQNRSSPAYKQFLQLTTRFQTVDGFIVNSILEMEEGPVKAFKENRGNQSLYLVGPITKTESNKEEEGLGLECLKWLDKQPSKSVLYVSFGGGGALSQDQTNELALGLEQSGKGFLWVMRAPSNSVNVGLSSGNEDPLRYLPEGYLERTKERGLVIPSWAPQVPILSHSSIGGFLSHCGWNSVIESVKLGVPLIAWPLFAEQRLNAVMLTNGLKVALWPKVNENGIVVKEEIRKVMKSLMEGEEGKEIYKRMTCLKEAAANAVKDGGSSTNALSEVTSKWRNFNGK